MIGPLEICLFDKENLASKSPSEKYTRLCLQDEGSPSVLIEESLKKLTNNSPQNEKYSLGYTLYIPLLKLFKSNEYDFDIDTNSIKRIANTINNTDKPVVLYLFSDHFKVGSLIEDLLSKNKANILQTKKGTLPIDQYYGEKIYPWSFVDKDNEITHLREKSINAVLDEVCKLPTKAIERIAGITMLGEIHHMFPDFQAGMGFSGDYLITDYSEKSIQGFQDFLAEKFSSILYLNKHLDSNYSSFKEIHPPSKNIRIERLNNYFEHIDAYAHGVIPISGWIARKSNSLAAKDWIHIYKNGEFLVRTPATFGRQDVLTAHPELPSSDVGWQYNLNYSKMPTGIYSLDIFLESQDNSLVHLGSRQISIMDKSQSTPTQKISKNIINKVPPDKSIIFSIDTPLDLASYYYNPLAILWHGFRKEQISSYIKHFADIAKNKCIRPELIYSHQILPFSNPGWDETKFGVGRDLAVPKTVRLGVSLYGEASYGTSFFEWFSHTQRTAYGVTEFHPLKKMNAQELGFVLDAHYKNNAQFLSFFLGSVGLDENPKYEPYIFGIDPQNKYAGSDVLFYSLKEILK